MSVNVALEGPFYRNLDRAFADHGALGDVTDLQARLTFADVRAARCADRNALVADAVTVVVEAVAQLGDRALTALADDDAGDAGRQAGRALARVVAARTI